jgi:hypothetical protein
MPFITKFISEQTAKHGEAPMQMTLPDGTCVSEAAPMSIMLSQVGDQFAGRGEDSFITLAK